MKKQLALIFSVLFCALSLMAQQPSRAQSEAHLDFGKTQDPDIIEFALITDTHRYGPTADERISGDNIEAFVQYCNQHPELQFAVYGGDFMNAYDTDHEQALWCLNRSREDFQELRLPFYTTRGNHDCNGKQWKGDQRDNTQIITDEEYYQLFSPLSLSNPLRHPEGIVVDQAKPHGNYYYRDFDEQRFRFIMLNNYDRDSLEYYGYHGEQMKWLAEVALDFSQKESPSEWCFILVGHAFSINHAANPITRLMHAYVRGQDFSDTDFGVSYEGHYSRVPRAKLVAMLGGHFHEDIYWNWDGYNMISFSRGFATGGEVDTPDRFCFDHLVINTREKTIEDRRIGRGQSRLFSYATSQQLSPALAYPKVDGLGSYTQGGHGGRILHVSNLLDKGPGSLRWAVEQSGSRTIVFDINGTIQLQSPLVVKNDSLTIAGQTSPGLGIVLTGAPIQIHASEVILRYLTLQNNLVDGDFGQHGLILNHITTQTAEGTAITIERTEDVTVQECRFEGQPGNESPALIAGGFKASYYNNLWIDCINAMRFPDLEGGNRWIHVVRNVFENWRDHAMYGGGLQGEVSIEDNYLIPGTQTLNHHLLDVAEDGTARYYVTGNEMKGFPQYNRKNALMVGDRSGIPYHANPADTLDRPKMSPVQRPHSADFSKTCLVIAAFHNKPIFKHPSKALLYRTMYREAGSQYRPEEVCTDSLFTGDVEAYTLRIAEPERSIVVLFENDVHCAIGEYSYLAGLRDLVAADTAYVAITSSGDYLQGGAIGSLSQGQAIADIMQCINYDAITLGNHEFDFPFATTCKLLSDIGAPVVCANLRDVEQDTLLFAPFVIRQYGRRKVAFVGVTTPTVEDSNPMSLSDATGMRQIYDLSKANLYQRVQQSIDEARRQGADYVIVLSHLGERNESGITSHQLISRTHGIDAVFDGHTHSYVPQLQLPDAEGHQVLLAQTGSHFEHIGKLVIDPSGLLYVEMIDPKNLVFRDPRTARQIEIIQEQYMSQTEAKLGESLVDMRRYSLWRSADDDPHTINAGDLVTDAMRHVAKADLVWLNPGSIRQGLPAGPLTRGAIAGLLPYQNYICTLQLTGEQIHKMVEGLIRDLTPSEEKITPVSGIRVTLQARKKKKFSIAQLEIIDPATGQYTDIDPKRTYTVATTDYCLNIGWKMKIMLLNADIHNTGILYSEALSTYITEQLHGQVDASSIRYKDRVRLAKQ